MNQNRLIKTFASLTACAAFFGVSSVQADVTSDITVDSGSTASATVSITIDSLFGTETQTDDVTVGAGGGGTLVLGPGAEPFGEVEIATLQFALDDGTLDYCFFDIPIFGCQSLDVLATNLTFTMEGTASSPIDGKGVATFDATWNMTLNYDISSSIFGTSGSADESELATFSTKITTDGAGNLTCTDLNLGTIVGSIPPEELPVGVDEVLLTTTVDLSNAAMAGTYDPPKPDECPGDFNGDGIVDGGDFGGLLALWGPCAGCPQDLDGSGTIDGGDVGLFLSYWGVCP